MVVGSSSYLVGPLAVPSFPVIVLVALAVVSLANPSTVPWLVVVVVVVVVVDWPSSSRILAASFLAVAAAPSSSAEPLPLVWNPFDPFVDPFDPFVVPFDPFVDPFVVPFDPFVDPFVDPFDPFVVPFDPFVDPFASIDCSRSARPLVPFPPRSSFHVSPIHATVRHSSPHRPLPTGIGDFDPHHDSQRLRPSPSPSNSIELPRLIWVETCTPRHPPPNRAAAAWHAPIAPIGREPRRRCDGR